MIINSVKFSCRLLISLDYWDKMIDIKRIHRNIDSEILHVSFEAFEVFKGDISLPKSFLLSLFSQDTHPLHEVRRVHHPTLAHARDEEINRYIEE